MFDFFYPIKTTHTMLSVVLSSLTMFLERIWVDFLMFVLAMMVSEHDMKSNLVFMAVIIAAVTIVVLMIRSTLLKAFQFEEHAMHHREPSAASKEETFPTVKKNNAARIKRYTEIDDT